MSKLQDLITRCQETEASITLDDVVHALKSTEASDINNGGAKAQVEYIIESLGEEQGIKKIEEALQ